MAGRHFKPVNGAGPSLNRASGLFRGLVFAARMGWEKGPTDTSLLGSLDEIQNRRAIWDSSVDTDNYAISAQGRVVDSGDVSKDAQNWDPAPDAKIVLPEQASVAALVRTFSSANAGKVNNVFSMSDGWFAGRGIGLHVGDQQQYAMSVRGSGSNTSFAFTGASSLVIDRWDTAVVTWDFARIGVDEGFRFYVNGVRDVTLAAGNGGGGQVVPPLGTVDRVRITKRANDTRDWDGQIAVGLGWNRALSEPEVAEFHSDPWRLWRRFLHKEFMGLGDMSNQMGLAAADFQTFFLSF